MLLLTKNLLCPLSLEINCFLIKKSRLGLLFLFLFDMRKFSNFFSAIFFLFPLFLFSQNYWQQRVDYEMSVDMDVNTFLYSGKQKLFYTNNSPDTIQKVFYHLFFNAFQKGSEMAVRIKTGKDKNHRFKIDIDSLLPNEEGLSLIHI